MGYPCFAKFLSCIIKSFKCAFSYFKYRQLELQISLRVLLSVHLRGFVVLHFQFQKILVSFSISFWIHSTINNELFTLHEFVYLPEICLLSILSCTALWADKYKKCGGLNESSQYRLICLPAWSPVIELFAED